MSVYAISDLHSSYSLWKQIIDYLKPEDHLYVLGDSADRGELGWEMIKEALRHPQVTYIRGNHDQMILDAWFSEWRDCDIWFYNGGNETFESIQTDDRSEIYLRELSKTKLYHCYENTNGKKVWLSHAGWTLMENNEPPSKEDILWDRLHIEDKCDWWPEQNPDTYMVHGHTPIVSNKFMYLNKVFPDKYIYNENTTMMKYAHGHKICIDSCVAYSDRIGLLNLDTLKIEKEFGVNE